MNCNAVRVHLFDHYLYAKYVMHVLLFRIIRFITHIHRLHAYVCRVVSCALDAVALNHNGICCCEHCQYKECETQ